MLPVTILIPGTQTRIDYEKCEHCGHKTNEIGRQLFEEYLLIQDKIDLCDLSRKEDRIIMKTLCKQQQEIIEKIRMITNGYHKTQYKTRKVAV